MERERRERSDEGTSACNASDAAHRRSKKDDDRLLLSQELDRCSRNTRSAGPIGENRSGERLEIGRAASAPSSGSSLRAVASNSRQSLAAVDWSERDLRAKQVDTRAREFLERRLFGGGDQRERRVERARTQHRVCGGKCAVEWVTVWAARDA
jgi:hypothetical protein